MNEGNCAELAKYSDVDGFLVGGASLDAEKFVQIWQETRTRVHRLR